MTELNVTGGDSSAAGDAGRHNIGRKRLEIVELRPIVLLKHLKRELELVVQRHTTHGVRDGRFMHDDALHVPKPPPAFAWW
jgi:hypothetical protein